MDLIKLICEEVVFNHWSYSEGKGLVTLPDHYRSDIINPLRFDLKGTWYLSRIEKKDLDRIFIISSKDCKFR